MDGRLLRYFLETYSRMKITAAAEALHISQPALTKNIKLLEENLGVTLFERTPNGMIPTPYGETLARYATTIFREYEHALAELEGMKGGSAGRLRIGAGPVWLMHFLPPAIITFKESHPGIRIEVQGSMHNTLIPSLLRGELDIFCGSLDFPDHAQIDKTPICNIDHVVLAAADHPLASQETIRPDDLLAYPWAVLARDDVGIRNLSAYFAGNGLPPPLIGLETPSISCILEAVRAGSFLTSVARPLLNSHHGTGLATVPIPGTIWAYEAGFAVRKSLIPRRSVDHFVELLRHVQTY